MLWYNLSYLILNNRDIFKENFSYYFRGWSDTISYLNNFNVKLNKLKWSESLSQSWYDLISDQGPKGGTGHIGSNGSTPFKRIEKYTKNSGSGENLTFLDVIYPEDPIVKLLIDDGVQGKGHRENILNKDFTHLGVSWGCHKLYGEMCCFDYGINVIENNPKLNANTAPQLKSCTNYQINTKDDLTTNYILTSTNGSQAGSSFNTNINGNKISISTEIKNMSSGIITKSYKINVVRSTGATSNYSYSWTGTESLAPSNEAVLGYFGLK